MPATQPAAVDPNLPRTWIQPHYGSFNGLRSLAVLSVFLHHYAGFWGLRVPQLIGWSGVDLFFVLSGFLITGILYDTLDTPHYFRNFYVRRALRIFPIFYGFFLLLFLLTPLLHLVYSPTLLTFFFYVGNLYTPFGLLKHINPTMISVYHHGRLTEVMNIGHLWSLCVEEQFYLLWPAVIFFIRDRIRLMHLCAGICLLVLLTRLALYRHYGVGLLFHWNTFTRCDTLLTGAWMALWLRGRQLSRNQLRRLSVTLFAVPATIVIAGILRMAMQHPDRSVYDVISSTFIDSVGYTLIALAFAGVLLRSLDDTSYLSRFLRLSPLNALGVISYGFYFVHALPEDLLGLYAAYHPQYLRAVPVIGFVFSVVLATLSFRYIETPFLRLKRTLAPQQPMRRQDDPLAPVHLHISEPGI